MKILGINTATEVCGVAVMESSASGGGHLLCEYRLSTGFLHAEYLLVLIDRALKDLKLGLDDLDGMALAIGPGSFTGLRVAVSTIKGLLIGVPKPVVSVSTLEALAWNVPMTSYLICPLLDAKKQAVYAALFVSEKSGELKRLMEDQVIAPEALLNQVWDKGNILFLGDGARRYHDLIHDRLGEVARFVPPAQHDSMASVVAQIGLERLKQGQQTDIKTLTPNYLRRSEAEVKFERQKG